MKWIPYDEFHAICKICCFLTSSLPLQDIQMVTYKNNAFSRIVLQYFEH